MLKYGLIGVSAAALTLLLTPWVSRLAFWLGAVDKPGGRHLHQGRVPRLGGIAVLAAFVGALVAGHLADILLVDVFLGHHWGWCWLLAGMLVVTAVGAADDIWSLGPIPKLAMQVLAGVTVLAGGYGIDAITNPLTGASVGLGWLRIPLTLLWVVGITNAFNLIDGLDGLAAGVALIASATLLVVSLASNNVEVALLAVTLAGTLAGFLCYNFNPASIFLGDSGSLLLGYLLSVLSIHAGQKGTTAVVVLTPLLTLGLPIMDTLLAMLRRLMGVLHVVRPDHEHNEYHFLVIGSAAVFRSDRDHIHHRLLAMGLTHRRAVLLLYGVCVGLSVMAFVAVSVRGVHSALLAAALVVGSYLAIRELGYHEVEVLRQGTLLPLLEWPVLNRRVVRVLADAGFVAIAYYGSLLAANARSFNTDVRTYFLVSAIVVVAVKLGTFAYTGMYQRAFRYSNGADLLALVKSLVIAQAAAAFVIPLLYGMPRHPAVVLLLDFYFNASLTMGARVAFTVLETLATACGEDDSDAQPVLIYGAGRAGSALLREFTQNRSLGYRPVGFLDDLPSLWGRRINGVPVVGGVNDLAGVLARDSVSAVILSTEKLPRPQIEAVAAACQAHGVELRCFRMTLEQVDVPSLRTGAEPRPLAQVRAG